MKHESINYEDICNLSQEDDNESDVLSCKIQ